LVTNKEFHDFINAGGYTTERYWPSEIGLRWSRNDNHTIQSLIKNANDVALIHLSSELAGQRLVPDEIPDRCIEMIKRKLPLYWADPMYNRPNQPIVGINWWEAVAYCIWLDETLKKAGVLDAERIVRLPIETEWEAVARECGEGNVFPWVKGDPADCALVRAAFNKGSNAPVFRSCGVGLFQFVKTKLPVFDLVGNVWEWTASKAHPYNAQSFEQTLDTSGLEDRIARGSSWLSSEEESTQVTFRSFDPPYNAYEDLGFRIVII
jgi:formylglycine-generating enzyme required for sulfatase activity